LSIIGRVEKTNQNATTKAGRRFVSIRVLEQFKKLNDSKSSQKVFKRTHFFSEGTSNSFSQLGNLQVIDCYLHEQ
jgi:hypothetical protein